MKLRTPTPSGGWKSLPKTQVSWVQSRSEASNLEIAVTPPCKYLFGYVCVGARNTHRNYMTYSYTSGARVQQVSPRVLSPKNA